MALINVLEVSVEDESSFAENASDPSSNTYTTRLPVLSVEPSLTQERGESDGSLQTFLHRMRPGYLGPREGEIVLRVPWTGHITTAAGALTSNWLHALLGDGLGGSDATQVGDTAETGSTASNLVITGGTLSNGGVVRVGAIGDGRAEGHAAVIDTYSTPNAALLTDLPAAPNNGDVVYAALMSWLNETLGTSKRFLIGYPETGAQWHAMGCQLKGLGFTLAQGGLPELELTYQVAYWDRAAETIPSGDALESFATAALTGNSLFYQDQGTSTRVLKSVTEINVSMAYELAIKRTTGGSAQYQTITGYERGPVKTTVDFLVQDWESDHETLFDTDGPDTTLKHLLFEGQRADGRSIGFYCPELYPVAERPQYDDANGITGVRATLMSTQAADVAPTLQNTQMALWQA